MTKGHCCGSDLLSENNVFYISEKYLESYNDVFADILSVLLFDGQRHINPSELSESITETQYKADGKPHEQRRDIAKLWEKQKTELVLIGLENQTEVDKDMVFRIAGYDGAYYRAQLTDGKKERYPVATIVLYFGMDRWDAATSLYEVVSIPEEMKRYINDYKIHVFEIAYLTEEQVNSFQSDFRFVADYFVQKRKNKHYVPPKGVIKHVDALLQMMAALTHDKRFEVASGEWKGEEKVMSEIFLDQIEERGEQKKLIRLICKKMAKGKIPEVIADELEEDEMVIQGIYETALTFAPDYDCNKIYEEWKKSQE